MSRWSDRFIQHGFSTILKDLTKKLEDFALPEESDKNTAIELGRLKKVITYINTILSTADPELLSPHIFNEMQGPLQNTVNEFNNFSANKNFAHIKQANEHIDQLLNIVSRAFVYYSKPTKTNINTIIKSYQDTLDEHLDALKTTADKSLQAIHDKIKEEETKLASLNTEVDEAKAELKAVKDQTKSQIDEFSGQFRDQQNKHQERFEGWINTKNDHADSEFKVLSIKSATILEVLKKFKDDAEEVFGVVQNTVQAGAHKRYADEEKRSANRYRFWAIALMLLAVTILIAPEFINFFKDDDFAFKWENLLNRLPISFVIFAPAFYLARESGKHRTNEFHNRRQELTLRTIDSYLALLDDNDKRNDIKGHIAQSVFGNGPAQSSEDTSGILAQLSNLIKQLGKVGQ